MKFKKIVFSPSGTKCRPNEKSIIFYYEDPTQLKKWEIYLEQPFKENWEVYYGTEQVQLYILQNKEKKGRLGSFQNTLSL